MNATNGGAQRARPASIVLGAGLLFAVGGIGFLLGTMRAESKPNPAPALAAPSDAAEPAWSHDLRTDLRALAEAIRNMPAPAVDRAPAVPQRDDSVALQAILSRLESHIARIESAPVTSRAAVPVADTRLLERLDRESQKFEWHAETGFADEFGPWGTSRGEELTRAHLLWTLDEVLAVYGQPGTVVQSSGQIFMLEYPFRRLDDSISLGLAFQFASERVIQATVDTVSTPSR